MNDKTRAIASIVCAEKLYAKLPYLSGYLADVVDAITFREKGSRIAFTGIDTGVHLTGPVVLIRAESDVQNVQEALSEHMAPFAPLAVYQLSGDENRDRDEITKLVMVSLNDVCRSAAGRNMDLRRQLARLRVEMETTTEMVETLKAQNTRLGGTALNTEVLRWRPGLEMIEAPYGRNIEQRLPRETRGTPLGAVCLLATNRNDRAVDCFFQIVDDDSEDVLAERLISIGEGQSWVLFSVPEHGLSMFKFRRLRITPKANAAEFLSFRKTSAVEPVEKLFVDGALIDGALAMRLYSGSFDEQALQTHSVGNSENFAALGLPQDIINRLEPVSKIQKPEKWLTPAKNGVLVHPSQDDVSVAHGVLEHTDQAVLGFAATASLLNPKSHPTMFRYLVLPEAADEAVLRAMRKDGSFEKATEVIADSGWMTVLPNTQSAMPTLIFKGGITTGHLYLATRPANGKTAFCHARFINLSWFLGNGSA